MSKILDEPLKIHHLSSNCVQCGWCISYCTNDCIVRTRSDTVVFIKQNCTFCKECEEVCPRNAIHFK